MDGVLPGDPAAAEAGVVIHIHDILLPDDYLAGHLRRLWNVEQVPAGRPAVQRQRVRDPVPVLVHEQQPADGGIRDEVLRQGPLSHLSLHGMLFWMRKT